MVYFLQLLNFLVKFFCLWSILSWILLTATENKRTYITNSVREMLCVQNLRMIKCIYLKLHMKFLINTYYKVFYQRRNFPYIWVVLTRVYVWTGGFSPGLSHTLPPLATVTGVHCVPDCCGSSAGCQVTRYQRQLQGSHLHRPGCGLCHPCLVGLGPLWIGMFIICLFLLITAPVSQIYCNTVM